MPGIIKKVKNHKKAAAAVLLILLIIAVLLFFRMFVLAAITIAAVIVNEFTVRKMNKQKDPFWKYSKIRNVDFLVIGDINPKAVQSLSESGRTISIFLPGCTLAGAYEVLRHTFSILKESGGTAVLVVRKKNVERIGYSPFEISFFHPVTVNRLGLIQAKYALKLPILFAPIKSLLFLSGLKGVKNASEHCNKEISGFCAERGIEGRLYIII